MKKYYFVNFDVILKEGRRLNHMNIFEINKDFFPVLEVTNKLKIFFTNETGEKVNILINNFIEVDLNSYNEFHSDGYLDFMKD